MCALLILSAERFELLAMQKDVHRVGPTGYPQLDGFLLFKREFPDRLLASVFVWPNQPSGVPGCW
jgi:hypothetical protein